MTIQKRRAIIIKKENALGAYNKNINKRDHKCCKCGHKPGGQKCPENKKTKP